MISAQKNRVGGREGDSGAEEAFLARRCMWNRSLEGQALERVLEEQADALLGAATPNPQYPAYTEGQLERHGQGKRLPLQDAFIEHITAPPTRDNCLEEIAFLASLASLSSGERLALSAALLGDTQAEIGRLFVPALTQQQVSRLLRNAARRCYAQGMLPFSLFSRHTIYRRPSRRRHTERGRFCARCQDWFPYGLGVGRYCSERCRGTGRRE